MPTLIVDYQPKFTKFFGTRPDTGAVVTLYVMMPGGLDLLIATLPVALYSEELEQAVKASFLLGMKAHTDMLRTGASHLRFAPLEP